MLFILLVPLTVYFLIGPLFSGEFVIKEKSIKNCQCSICKERMEKRKKIYRFAELNKSYLIKIIILSFFWYLTWTCYEKIKNVEMLKGFVPHEILNVEIDAPLTKIKKAFRKLSREKHPDKNPNNPQAVVEFIEITKAY
jgi:preprotein translocase subunit Sec63